MAHQEGPTKGLVTFVNDEDAESKQLIVEPLHLTAAEYATMMAGGSFSGSVLADLAVNRKYVELTNGTLDTVTVTESFVGVGDAAQTVFTKTFTETPIVVSSLTVTADSVVGTDDGAGAITGAGITAGTIDYATGDISVTFTAAPASEIPVTADFTRGE